LDQWDADIEKLQAKARQAEANMQIEFQKQLEVLQRKRRLAEKKLEEVKSASEDAWEDFKTGVESARDALGNAVESATARFG